jgi:SpoVK/Ycf46/Vps4 family AAA+-type ATPase
MKFTSPENYASLHKRLLANGMNPGLTMMFYGPPGTGKTELVRQIARMHHLPVLQVDIGKIKNMWVGESEKNLNRVFDEYKSALDHFKNTPILLFNEADGILGIRKNVKNSVDQMYNTMQNIILQKLESFIGIFVATTNLTNNIDGAFDRRMLYKQRFDLPDENTRLRILENAFPAFSGELLQDVSRKYNLSGGQIQNIKKKFVVDEILYEEKHNITGNILRYIEEETRFRSITITTIGYKLSS